MPSNTPIPQSWLTFSEIISKKYRWNILGWGLGEQVAGDKELQVHDRRRALIPIISHYQANHTMQIAALISWPSGLEKTFPQLAILK